MTLEQAIKILSEHNRWRVGEIDAYTHKPSEITQAIDLVLEAVREKGDKPTCLGDDSGSLLTNEQIIKLADEYANQSYSKDANPISHESLTEPFIDGFKKAMELLLGNDR